MSSSDYRKKKHLLLKLLQSEDTKAVEPVVSIDH